MMEKPKSSKKQKLNATMEITATVVLEKKILSSLHDAADELLGRKVAFQLITDAPDRGRDGVKKAYIEGWISGGYKVRFEWSEDLGAPLAFSVTNLHHSEFYLKSLTLETVPGHGCVHFLCNSWVYPAANYSKERVFFSNQPYLPWETPAALVAYRKEELESLRGNGKGKMEEWDRVYDFDIYNDLGEPEKGIDYVRPILGDSSEFPYPRRGRTGRPPSSSDLKCESRLPLYESLNIYVPRDEKFSSIKMSDFIAYALKSIFQFLAPEFKDLFDETRGEFDSFDDVMQLYDGGIKITQGSVLDRIRKAIPFETIRELLRSDGEGALKFPLPQIIQEDKTAWRSDEEFAREMIAGLNPVVISRLKEFPPVSHLDPQMYGDQSSKLTVDHIQDGLEGMTVEEALEKNRLYILDHHDHMMPYLARINTTATKTYATRTILYLAKDGTLKPLAIELSLPYPQGHPGAVSSVYTPAKDGVQATIWQLAKCHVSINDSGYHQLICHWLHTHATIEPFIIATHRQLSVMHPIHKLLHPHFKDTMNINALARQTLINAGGFLEITVFPAKYSLEMSSLLYKNWVFTEQALPADLLKRGVAVEDSRCTHGIRLLIEDYPYAVDGLEIWAAIRTWVNDYCNIYYNTDESVQNDVELQSWWKDVREKGHGDKKHEPWWPKMKTIKDLTDSCTIIIWVASALHAAVNFGQYPYGGYLPNRPSMSRRFIPEPGTPEYKELESDPDKAFLKSITSQLQSILGISLVEILSRHPEDEVFLGQRDSPEWTSDKEAIKTFEKFGARLEKIEKKIIEMNNDGKLKNRFGPVKLPYTLLYPSSGIGITGKGIPNSISI